MERTEEAADIAEGDDDFYEEVGVDWTSSLGDLKTNNPAGDRFQRQFVHISSEKSPFKKTVDIVLCVHGWETAEKRQPMTLLILGVSLKCHARDFRIQSARIWLGFHEDDMTDAKLGEQARPEVVAYAPWVDLETWGDSTEQIKEASEYGASAGLDQFAKGDLNIKRSIERSYERKHFERGTAERLVDEKTGRVNGVEWYCEQNELQVYGIQPHFHLAVLLKRSHNKDGKPVTFRAEYDMRIEAGFKHNISQGIRRLFRLRKPEDAPIYFDPSRKPMTAGLENKGAQFLSKLDIERLGDLAENDHLNKILDADTGTMLPGLETLQPPVP